MNETKKTEEMNLKVDKAAQLELENIRLKSLIANFPGAVYIFRLDPDGKMHFPFVSPQLLDFFRITREKFIEDPSIFISMVDPRDQMHLKELIYESAQKMSRFEWTGRIISNDQQQKWVKVKSLPQKLDNGITEWNGVLLDVTDETLMSEALLKERARNLHAAKLATLGELAAGVAHEVNNPLAIIQGAVHLIEKELPQDSPALKRVQSIQKSIHRIARIIGGLRKFSRGPMNSVYDLHSVEEIVNEAVSLVELRLTQLSVRLMATSCCSAKIKCDEVEIEQVLINLLNNAVDAASLSAEKWVRVHVFERDNFIVFRIFDSGPGVPAGLREKIFEPFYTTKKVGEGTGLGLSVAKGIVEAHGGRIFIQESLPESCFEFQLPKFNIKS